MPDQNDAMSDQQADHKLPLSGIRVLDFGRYIAGPYCAALLAEFGAEVIRIEKRGGSEDRYVTPVTDHGDGALFIQMNRNKRSLTLNPKSPGGREIVRKLVATSDVVVANLPASTLESMGLSYVQLREVKPDIILTTVSAFGDKGPWSERVGFDSVAQAMCGAAYLSGNEMPSRSQASWVDFGTALHCAVGVLVALIDRQHCGQGQQVSANLLSTAITMMNAQLMEQELAEVNRPPLGSTAAGAAPIGMFQASDGWVACHVVGQPLFDRLARLVECEHWLSDPRFATDPSRGEHREPIMERVSAWCLERTRDEVLEAFAARRIPAGPVLTPQEVLDHPQTGATGVLQSVDYDGLDKPASVARCPVWLSAHETTLQPPVRLGTDTHAILQSLGYQQCDIHRFKEQDAI